MTRKWFAFLLFAGLPAPAPAQEPQYREPVEEDEDLTRPAEYALNPLQAAKELQVGDFYAKKGSWRAAEGRYQEATRWNPGFVEAYFKLGVAREKVAEKEIGDARQLKLKAAAEAFRKCLDLEPAGKRASDAKKRLARLEGGR